MNEKIPSHKKRIGETYRWRNSTIVDRHPEMIKFLRDKPLYVDALYLRKILLKKMKLEAHCRKHVATTEPKIKIFFKSNRYIFKILNQFELGFLNQC